MFRFLLLLLAALVALWSLMRRFTASPARKQPARRSRRPQPSRRLVRDPVCETHLPEDRALVLETPAGREFFCSEACRTRFLSTARGPAD